MSELNISVGKLNLIRYSVREATSRAFLESSSFSIFNHPLLPKGLAVSILDNPLARPHNLTSRRTHGNIR